MKFRLALLITAMVPAPVLANYCAAPLSRTNATISGGIVNTYFPITVEFSGGASLTLGPARLCAGCPQEDIKVGDLLLMYQPQYAQLANSTTQTFGSGVSTGQYAGRGWNQLNHTGKFQWLRVTGDTVDRPHGTVVKAAAATGPVRVQSGVLPGPTLSASPTGPSVRAGQVILVPQYGNLTVTGTLTAPPWRQLNNSGAAGPLSTGGIVALDVAGTLTFTGGAINVKEKGFRGGAGTPLAGWNVSQNPFNVSNTWGHGAILGTPRPFGGIKGEGAAATPYSVYDEGTVVTGLNYSASNATLSGEGYGTPAITTAFGRGAPANAGGGATDQCPLSDNIVNSSTAGTMCRSGAGITVHYNGNGLNTGGGGGAGAGDGGKGGEQDMDGVTATRTHSGGGLGGRGIYPHTVFGADGVVFQPLLGGAHQYAPLGGGGGAGSTNDAVNFANSSGGTGGGAVVIRAGRIAGSATINADGGNAPTALTADGGGGGGGGGWILVSSRLASSPTLTMSARGGAGGGSGGGMGAGGGGGGGYIGTSTTLPAPSMSGVTGGAAGVRSGTLADATAVAAVQATNAEAGLNGFVGQFNASALSIPAVGVPDLANSSVSVAPGPQCVPIVTKSFSTDGGATYLSSVNVAAGQTFKMKITVENPNENATGAATSTPQLFTDLSFTDTYPADLKNATPPNVQQSNCNGATVTAVADGTTLAATSAGGVDGQTTCEITVDVVRTATGSRTNTIPAAGVTVTHSKEATPNATLTLTNYEDVSATVIVPAGVTVAKTSAAVSDPINNTTNPKRIPGATVDYTVTVSNTAGSALTTDTMNVVDILPTQLKLFVGDLVGGAPFEFGAGTSALTCGFVSLADQTDCVDFSTLANPNPNLQSDWNYVPTPDGAMSDAAVRAIRYRPPGTMPNNGQFTVRYRTIVK